MDFSYPPEVEQVRKELRAWLAANLTDDVVAAGRQRGKDDAAFEKLRAWNATMADAGWGAVSWPQEYGGRGATVLEQLVYAEETTRARVPMPLNVPATFWVVSRKVLRSSIVWLRGRLEAGSLAAAVKSENTVDSWLR